MKLNEYLKANGIGQSEFARLCGVSKQLVWYWASGRVIPRYDMMLKIRDITLGVVSLESWENKDVNSK